MKNQSIRLAGNQDRFYPSQRQSIQDMITGWDKILIAKNFENSSEINPRIAIVPHAGYIYSGFTAYSALNKLANSYFKTLVVVGPSHYLNIHGFSIAEHDEFETPFGNLQNDNEMVDKIESSFDVDYSPKVHYLEHSTENQFPLIKYIFPDCKIIEIIYGQIPVESLYNLFEYLLQTENTGLIISTDLSHFHDQNTATIIDKNCIDSLKELNSELMQKCEACGKPGLHAILKYCILKDKKVNIIDYRTSAEVSGDKKRVVGYLGAVI
jgi:MEMO1 family protein